MSGFSTRAIRAASRVPRVDQKSTTVPIYQTATFATDDAEELAAVLADRIPGYAYSRLDNPTVVALGEAIAELEGAEAGFALATGMAAIHAALASLLRAGDRVVFPLASYGSTRVMLTGYFARLGVRTDIVDITDHAAVGAALAAGPVRLLFAETIANPNLVVADIGSLAELAHGHGALLIIDNTFASPFACRPLEHGADLVIESATKWLGGHSDVMAGVVAGPRELVAPIRAVQVDTGAMLSPFSAFLVLRGMTTLAVRMERHSASALALATWLEGRDGVRRVFHPSLPSHPQHEVARRQFDIGGGMLAFELEGGRAAGAAFIDALTVPERTASLGSVHTMVMHPPTTSHRQLSDGELAAAGIDPGLLRCSVGLEDLDDLREDFARGLAAARAAVVPAVGASAG